MLAAVLYGPKDLGIEAVADVPLQSDEVRVRIAYGGICWISLE
jgi:threonine dehydrogenase-like Zn-dependent dehydrogenase